MAVLLAACGGLRGDDGAVATQSPAPSTTAGTESPSPSTNQTPSQTPDPTPSQTPTPAESGPPFPTTTDPQTSEPDGSRDLQLVDVRLGEHDGFDRIVLEFTGTTTPGWGVAYGDRAVAEGSGEIIELAGDRVLTISASGLSLPDDSSLPPGQRLDGSGEVAEVYVGGWFEGYTQVFAGVDGDERPFRVFALADPPRLVVDVSR